MIKKSVTYTDFNGDKQTEEFHFHLTKLELAKLEHSTKGGLQAAIQTAIESQDTKVIFEAFTDIVLESYGVRSADGKRFTKSSELRADFASSPACSELIFGFLTDPDEGNAFFAGVLPTNIEADLDAAKARQSLSDAAKEQFAKQGAKIPGFTTPVESHLVPDAVGEPKPAVFVPETITHAQAAVMEPEMLQSALARGVQIVG